MNKYIFYETNTGVWFCPKNSWERYKYEKEITPTRMAILEASEECIEALFDILDECQEQFVEIIKDELSSSLDTLYSN